MKKEITKDQIRLACYEILGTRRSDDDEKKIVKIKPFSIFGERRLKEELLDKLKKKLVYIFDAFPEVDYDFLYDDVCYNAYNLRIVDYNDSLSEYYSIIIESAGYKENYKEQLRITRDYRKGSKDNDITFRFVKGYIAQKEEGEGYDFIEEKVIGEWTDIEGRMARCSDPGEKYYKYDLKHLTEFMYEGVVEKIRYYHIRGLSDLGDRRPWSIFKDEKCRYNFPWMLTGNVEWPHNIQKFIVMEYLRQVVIPKHDNQEILKNVIINARSVTVPRIDSKSSREILTTLWNALDRKVLFSSFWSDGITTQRHYREDGTSSFYYNNGKQKDEDYSEGKKTFEDYYPNFSENDLLDLINNNPANEYIKLMTGGFVYRIGYKGEVEMELDKEDFDKFIESGTIKFVKKDDGTPSQKMAHKDAEEITKFWYDYMGEDRFNSLKRDGCFF